MIHGHSVILRALERRDLEQLWKWENDPEVMEYASSSPERCVSHEALVRMFESGISADSFPKRYIIALKNGESLGLISYWMPNSRFNASADIGIYIGEKSQWHRGYGSDAIMALARVLFHHLNFHRIGFSLGSHNQRMRAVLEKCGMKCEGVIREDRYFHGQYWDTIRMGCLRQEFEAAWERREGESSSEHTPEPECAADIARV